MSQPPQPMLDRKFSDEFTAGMTDSLELWCRNTPTPTRIELLRFLAGGQTTAKVAVVRVYDHRGVTIRVVKHCPRPEGGAGVSLDARKYHDAESASQKFTQAHLAKLDEFVPDGNGGIFLLMEWRGGGSRNHQPLTAFLDRQELHVACRAIVKSTLIDWQKDSRKPPDRGSVCARAILQTIVGEKCLPGRSLHTIAADLDIADADRLEANRTAFANIFRAVSQGEGFADFQTAGIRGNGHGDLHPGNILVPGGGARPVTAAAQFDKYYLIDLSSFAPDRFLAIDPAHLTLSIANEWLGRLNPQQRRQLRELILDPTQADSGSLPLCIAKAVPAIARVGRELIAQATEEFRPDAEEAKQVTRGRLALVDGTLWPCWSWEGAHELWAGKYKTTGHGSLIISDESGNIIFVSDPAPGCDHDMKKLEGEVKEILDLAGSVIADKGFQGSGYVTPAKKPKNRELYMREHEYNNQVSSIRAPIERAVAHLKTWKILFTDYRRPLSTFLDSFRAAIGLYFFELSFR